MKADKKEAYKKVRDIIISKIPDEVSVCSPSERAQRTYRVAIGRQGHDTWFLMKDEDSGDMVLVKGEVVSVHGYTDGLNIYPRVSPLLSMMCDLGLISNQESDAFLDVVHRKTEEDRMKGAINQLRRQADTLGFDLVKRKKE